VGHVYGVAEGVLPVSDLPERAGPGSQLRVFGGRARVDAYSGFRDTSSVAEPSAGEPGESFLHVCGLVLPVLRASLPASGRWQLPGDDVLRVALRAERRLCTRRDSECLGDDDAHIARICTPPDINHRPSIE
jgi:hypothetical protein